ncbi:MAG: hypothetical protein MJ175_07560, partial [Clostridia bacterium]|nr:hypothetical protein [Clostridia bacterium]
LLVPQGLSPLGRDGIGTADSFMSIQGSALKIRKLLKNARTLSGQSPDRSKLFDGGAQPWVSSLSQKTSLQILDFFTKLW